MCNKRKECKCRKEEETEEFLEKYFQEWIIKSRVISKLPDGGIYNGNIDILNHCKILFIMAPENPIKKDYNKDNKQLVELHLDSYVRLSSLSKEIQEKIRKEIGLIE